MTQDFREKLALIVVDKLLIASLLLGGGVWLNGRLEQFKSDLVGQRAVAEERRAFLGRQLSEFYWPLYLRLQKDTDTWKVSPDAAHGIGSALDKEVLRPNRQEIARLIHENIYLAHADEQLMEKLQRLLRHIAVSEALRAQPSEHASPDPYSMAKEYGWPDDVLPSVRDATLTLQKRFDESAR